MITLRQFKKNKRLNTAEIAEMFGLTRRQYYHYRDLAKVEGKVGERQLVVTKKVHKIIGKEQPLEVFE